MHRFPYWRLSAYYLTYFAFAGAFLPYFGLYLQSRAFSAWQIGLLMSQMQLMRVFGPYLWGALADRTGKRLAIIRLTGVMSLVVFLAFFFISGFEAFLVAIAVLAFFWSAALPLAEALTFDHLREQTARYSRVRMWGSVGFIGAVLATGLLLDHLPMSSLKWICLATLLATPCFAYAVPEAAPQLATGKAPSVLRILLRVPVAALFAACFAMSAAHGALNIFYSILLSDHGYNKSVVGGLLSLGVFSEITAFLIMSWVMRHCRLRRILLLSFALAVLRFILIGWYVGSLPILVFAQLLHASTFGTFHAAAITAVNRWFPGSARSRGQALYSSLTFGAGGLLGGLLSGWTWEHWGGEVTFILSSGYALIGFILIAFWVRERDVSQTGASCVTPDSASA
jgi:PPP family 3-phenylpropionic acid transporter